MFTATLAFLNTPVFNYAAARYVGTSLLFAAGPSLVFAQQQVQGTTPSLSERQFKVLGTGLGIAGIFFAWGVPFTTTLPLALTYAIFLIVTGIIFGVKVALSQDPDWAAINKVLGTGLGIASIFFAWGVPFTTTLPLALTYAIFLIVTGIMFGVKVALSQDPDWAAINAVITTEINEGFRKHIGIHPDMGYILIPQAPNPLPAASELNWEGHPHRLTMTTYFPGTSQEELHYFESILHKNPELLPEGRESALFHIQNGQTFFVTRARSLLPESLPAAYTITREDLDQAIDSYEVIDPVDLDFLIGKGIQEIDDLGNLIVDHDPNLFERRHKIGAHLWRQLCGKHLSYTDETRHPIDPSVIVKRKSA